LEVGNLAMNYFSTIKLLLLALTFCTIWSSSVFPTLNWGESMVFYTKKFDEKISSLNRDNFSQKHKKVDSIFT
jgi:hypothetical protein